MIEKTKLNKKDIKTSEVKETIKEPVEEVMESQDTEIPITPTMERILKLLNDLPKKSITSKQYTETLRIIQQKVKR